MTRRLIPGGGTQRKLLWWKGLRSVLAVNTLVILASLVITIISRIAWRGKRRGGRREGAPNETGWLLTWHSLLSTQAIKHAIHTWARRRAHTHTRDHMSGLNGKSQVSNVHRRYCPRNRLPSLWDRLHLRVFLFTLEGFILHFKHFTNKLMRPVA